MSLATLVAEDTWQEFDRAWKELINSAGPVDDLIRALECVARKRRMPRCMNLAREHAARLAEAGRPADAALLLGTALTGGGPPGELCEPLYASSEKAWAQEPWWIAYCELSGFRPGAPDLRKAWTSFNDLRSYCEGVVVFHASGWGAGVVTDVRYAEQEIAVRFQSGRTDHFPMATAVAIFEILPFDDLRAQAFLDPHGLQHRLRDDPLEILRSLLLRYNGKASMIALRNALMQVGITGNAWTSWWRRTRQLAEHSEWFRITGNANKAEVQLLIRATDPVQGLRSHLRQSRTVSEALARVRDMLSAGKVSEPLRDAALETLAELAQARGARTEERVAVWMLLRDHRGKTPEGFIAELRLAAGKPTPSDPSAPPALWETFQLLSNARDQEQCVGLLEEIYGEEGWIEEAARHLPHAPPAMLRFLIEALRKADRTDALATHYHSLLARPTRAPFALIALAQALEAGPLGAELPGEVQRAQALVELAIHLEENRRGNPLLARAAYRLTQLLTEGSEPLLRKLLADSDPDALRNLRSMVQRGVDDAIDALITDIAIERSPESVRDEKPFWDTDRIWTTRSGLRRRETELRELREVKIPANRDALARAASYGDLSENSEWEQAIRDQSELTSLANQIEQELRLVSLLENALLPENTVCPGTAVRYRDASNGEVHEIVLLGPWDTDRDNAAFYRAPLPAGMLGKHCGDQPTIELPSGLIQVEILDIVPAPI